MALRPGCRTCGRRFIRRIDASDRSFSIFRSGFSPGAEKIEVAARHEVTIYRAHNFRLWRMRAGRDFPACRSPSKQTIAENYDQAICPGDAGAVGSVGDLSAVGLAKADDGDETYCKYLASRSLSSALARNRILFTAGTVVPITFAISSYGISSYRRRTIARRCVSGSLLIASWIAI